MNFVKYIILFLFALPASAAAQEKIECAATLKGKISQEKVDDIISILGKKPPRFPGESIVLCLNSPGGNIFEAMRLIDFMSIQASGSNGIMTYVPKGATCNSSCAFILLTGFICARYTCYNERSIHRSATVGFHTPFIPGRGVSADIQDLQTAYLLGVRVIKQLYENMTSSMSFDETNLRLSSEMLIDILSSPPDQMHELDSIGDLVKYKINLIGQRKKEKISINNFINACNNQWNWMAHKSTDSSKEPMWPNYRYFSFKQTGNLHGAAILLDTHYADRLWRTCHLYISDSGSDGGQTSVRGYFGSGFGQSAGITASSEGNISTDTGGGKSYTELTELGFLKKFKEKINTENYWMYLEPHYEK